MPSTFSSDLRVLSARNFKDFLSYTTGNSRLYVCFGKTTPWSNESAPDSANSSILAINNFWRNMIGAKLITGNDAKNVIPRNNWTANTEYSEYDNCMCCNDMYNQNTKFIVMNSNWDVYKCLSNNYGSNSKVEPTQTTTTSAIKETDGYIWKYLYTVSASDQLKFTTESYIPVKTLTVDDNSIQWDVQENAIDGGIEHIKVIDSGSGYTNANSITITITGDGELAAAIPTINTISNTIANVTVTNPGTGYSRAVIVINDTGTGTGANARAAIGPPGGHGYDPLSETGGFNLMLNPRLSGSENGKFPTENEYRQLGIMLDPLVEATGNIASNSTFSQFFTLVLNSGASNYDHDETVFQGGSLANATFSGTVASWDSANVTLKVINAEGTPSIDVINGVSSRTVRFVESITQRELKPFSGKIIYIENMIPITRADDQIEDYKIVLKF